MAENNMVVEERNVPLHEMYDADLAMATYQCEGCGKVITWPADYPVPICCGVTMHSMAPAS